MSSTEILRDPAREALRAAVTDGELFGWYPLQNNDGSWRFWLTYAAGGGEWKTPEEVLYWAHQRMFVARKWEPQ